MHNGVHKIICYFLSSIFSIVLLTNTSLANQFAKPNSSIDLSKFPQPDYKFTAFFDLKSALIANKGIYLGANNQVNGNIISENITDIKPRNVINGDIISVGRVKFIVDRVTQNNLSEVNGSITSSGVVSFDRDVDISGRVRERVNVNPDIDYPDWPANPGVKDVFVGRGQVVILDQGHYRRLIIEVEGTLIITGGKYHFSEVNIANKGKIIYENPTHFYVASSFNTAAKTKIVDDPASNLTPKDFSVIVHNQEKNNPVSLGAKSIFKGMLSSPRGMVFLRTQMNFTGILMANYISTEDFVFANYSEGCHPRPEICGDNIDQDCDLVDQQCDVCIPEPEICDGIDQDCDGIDDNGVQQRFYLDNDGDGFGGSDVFDEACEPLDGFVDNNLDCDDNNNQVFPNAGIEICGDGIDNDCVDGDLACPETDNDGDGVSVEAGDCDDNNPNRYPGLTEFCDGIDNDCDGFIDEDVDENTPGVRAFYLDNDGDGFGRNNQLVYFCNQPDIDRDGNGFDFVAINGDCNDEANNIYPGAAEFCNNQNIDFDCDGRINEPESVNALEWCKDRDQDLLGDGAVRTRACPVPDQVPINGTLRVNIAGLQYVNNEEDCNDLNPDPEIRKQTLYPDQDSDHFGVNRNTIYGCMENNPNYLASIAQGEDCDDNDPNVSLLRVWYADLDNDGFINSNSNRLSCHEPVNGHYILDGNAEEDCNDNNRNITRFTYYPDSDGDGFGIAENSVSGCVRPNGFVANLNNGIDCNDGDGFIHPDAPQYLGEEDTNCNGEVDLITENLTIKGSANNEHLGYVNQSNDIYNQIATCNLDGDGITDFVIGAPEYDYDAFGNPRQDAGVIYLVKGSELQAVNAVIGEQGNIWEMSEIASSTIYGFDSYCGLFPQCKDINNDGLDEVFFGCSGAYIRRYGAIEIPQTAMVILEGRENWQPSYNMETIVPRSGIRGDEELLANRMGMIIGRDAFTARPNGSDSLATFFKVIDGFSRENQFYVAHAPGQGAIYVRLFPISSNFIGRSIDFGNIINNSQNLFGEEIRSYMFRNTYFNANTANLGIEGIDLIEGDGASDICISNPSTIQDFFNVGGNVICIYGDQEFPAYTEDDRNDTRIFDWIDYLDDNENGRIMEYKHAVLYGTGPAADPRVLDYHHSGNMEVVDYRGEERLLVTSTNYSYLYSKDHINLISDIQAGGGYEIFEVQDLAGNTFLASVFPSSLLIPFIGDERFNDFVIIPHFDELENSYQDADSNPLVYTYSTYFNNQFYISGPWKNEGQGGVAIYDHQAQNGLTEVSAVIDGPLVNNTKFSFGYKTIPTHEGLLVLSGGADDPVLNFDQRSGVLHFIPFKPQN